MLRYKPHPRQKCRGFFAFAGRIIGQLKGILWEQRTRDREGTGVMDSARNRPKKSLENTIKKLSENTEYDIL